MALSQGIDPQDDAVAGASFSLTTKVLQQRLIDAPTMIAERIGYGRLYCSSVCVKPMAKRFSS